MWFRSCVVVAALLMLGACALQPREVPDDPEAAWQDLRERLEAMDAWRADGRLSVRMEDDSGSASFDWRERLEGGFTLHLSGPWGQGMARLRADNGRAVLDAGDDRVYTGTDAALLLHDLYGWDIPVDGLRRWLVGLPADDGGAASYELDAFGRLSRMSWRDWEIDYLRYGQVDGLDLPTRLEARRTDGATRVRVAIDRWRLTEDADADRDGSGVPLIGD